MTPQQMEQLAILQDKLFEVVVIEVDPDNWPGAGIKPCDMTKEQRGDTSWVRKSAAAALSMFVRLDDIRTRTNPRHLQPPDDDEDAQIRAAEREANKLIDRIVDRRRASDATQR